MSPYISGIHCVADLDLTRYLPDILPCGEAMRFNLPGIPGLKGGGINGRVTCKAVAGVPGLGYAPADHLLKR